MSRVVLFVALRQLWDRKLLNAIAVLGVMLGVLNAALVYLVLVTDDLPDPLDRPPPEAGDEPLEAEAVLT